MGRHKKECDCIKCIAKRAEKLTDLNRPETAEQTTTTTSETPPNPVTAKSHDDFISLWNNTAEQTEQTDQTEQTTPIPEANLISGMILLSMIDAIAPVVFLKIGGMFSANIKKISVNKIRLTTQEKKELENLADIVGRQVIGNMPPLQLFIGSLFLIYAGKIIDEI